jgi:hypothetical protein
VGVVILIAAVVLWRPWRTEDRQVIELSGLLTALLLTGLLFA